MPHDPTHRLLREMRLLLLEEGHCFRDQALSFCYAGQAAPAGKGRIYVEHVALSNDAVLGQLDAGNAAYVLEQTYKFGRDERGNHV